jgi:hypothetical protein
VEYLTGYAIAYGYAIMVLGKQKRWIYSGVWFMTHHNVLLPGGELIHVVSCTGWPLGYFTSLFLGFCL